eukprot:8516270-Ditylum_brightwellii.AAC.1
MSKQLLNIMFADSMSIDEICKCDIHGISFFGLGASNSADCFATSLFKMFDLGVYVHCVCCTDNAVREL